MSNKIKSVFKIKGMVLTKNLSKYDFFNDSTNELLCSINLPNGVFLDINELEKSFKISLISNNEIHNKIKLKKNLKKKLGFISNFLKENVKLKKKITTGDINLIGTGFKVFQSKIKENEIIFKIGFSHLVKVTVPEKISFKILKMNEIKFSSFDKELLGSFLNFVSNIRLPDSYKGRGILIPGKSKSRLKKGKIKS